MLSDIGYATHLRAIEISARKVPGQGNKFIFTVTAFRDTQGVEFGNGTFFFDILGQPDLFDDGPFDISEPVLVEEETERLTFQVEHVYAAPGDYIVAYREENRNANINNINDGGSVDIPFYVQTKITIDPIIGENDTPILTVPPIDRGAQFIKFLHNPGAFDPDGDSLSYEFTIPKQDANFEVPNYRDLNDPRFYQGFFDTGNEAQNGTPTLTLDPITGDLAWDAPGLIGEYQVAFVVKEWRFINGVWEQLGFVTRDMQIIIDMTDSERPELEVPPDICVVAGSSINQSVVGTDPDGQRVVMEAFGGPFELPSSPATFSPFPPAEQNPPAVLRFNWNTNCTHVRQRPYQVEFKISDVPDLGTGPSLVNFGTWNIQVVAPAPEGLTTSARSARSIELNWDNYDCGSADRMQIWRRVDSFEINPDSCEVGMPDFAGYELIDVVNIDQNSYIDDSQGLGLDPGALYCYRLVAQFPQPRGGESIVSAESCTLIDADAPVITNVDIKTTGENDGIIEVRWTPPFDIDSEQFPPPYSYEVLRSQGFLGNQDVSVSEIISDTFFIDDNLNTLNQVYNYTVRLFDAENNFIDTSARASSVRLELEALLNAIDLEWEAKVPWSNRSQDYPTHYIYRNEVEGNDSDDLVLIDSVDVNLSGFNYFDDGSFNDQPLDQETIYCYFVTTRGTYGNERILEPLLNSSQIICGQPNDQEPPCSPLAFSLDPDFVCEEFLTNQNCTFSEFFNELVWQIDDSENCDNDLSHFNVYFSDLGEEGTFSLIAEVNGTSFRHDNLPSFKGCYQISAVDRSGNESGLSEIVCNDNCPNFILPNVFTPNNDGINDTFTPFFNLGGGGSEGGGNLPTGIEGFDNSTCVRFVERVVFQVFNRDGNVIFDFESEGENSILIEWDGTTNDGNELPSGTYFYEVNVTFDVLDQSNAEESFNGWVQILR